MISKYLAIACGVLVLLLAGTGYLLRESYKDNGALKNANTALSKTLKEKEDALKNRARIEQNVRALPDDALLDKLR